MTKSKDQAERRILRSFVNRIVTAAIAEVGFNDGTARSELLRVRYRVAAEAADLLTSDVGMREVRRIVR